MPLAAAGRPLRALAETAKVLAACHVAMALGVSASACHGPSMLPTFAVAGDWVLTSKLHRRGRGVRVGDLVAYTIPTYPRSEGVKRVLGLPGDYVLAGTPAGGGSGGGGDGGMIQVCRLSPGLGNHGLCSVE